ncbi:GNAT family N-acetyltransferase [Nonomuraea rhodomycinica]|uniref:GNAT family N-acetyltransferase n=1 Tax=Nonomuraea rhodomycinica TaxID=1712872 RepID=A0A7Y6III8_9ACTN|nr:GNAT family N-acetyltransferase [Nonomuraea rhodomycinica]
MARILAFTHAFLRRKAGRVAAVPGGFAVLNDRYPASHDDNRLVVPAPGRPGDAVPAEEVLRAADEALAGRRHRYVCVDDDALGAAYAPAFAAAGYDHETNVVMAFRGVPPADAPRAEELTLEELLPVLRHDWREALPNIPDDSVEQLAARVEERRRGADVVRFRGVRAGGGEIAARAELYVQDGVAQIESVHTGTRHRGRGHARALVRALLAEAAGCEPIFLMAAEEDWPKDFYARLGFTTIGRTHAFLRL